MNTDSVSIYFVNNKAYPYIEPEVISECLRNVAWLAEDRIELLAEGKAFFELSLKIFGEIDGIQWLNFF